MAAGWYVIALQFQAFILLSDINKNGQHASTLHFTPPTAQKWSQGIPDISTTIFFWWRRLEQELVQYELKLSFCALIVNEFN